MEAPLFSTYSSLSVAMINRRKTYGRFLAFCKFLEKLAKKSSLPSLENMEAPLFSTYSSPPVAMINRRKTWKILCVLQVFGEVG